MKKTDYDTPSRRAWLANLEGHIERVLTDHNWPLMPAKQPGSMYGVSDLMGRGWPMLASLVHNLLEGYAYKTAGYPTHEIYCKERWGWSPQVCGTFIRADRTALCLDVNRPDFPNFAQAWTLGVITLPQSKEPDRDKIRAIVDSTDFGTITVKGLLRKVQEAYPKPPNKKWTRRTPATSPEPVLSREERLLAQCEAAIDPEWRTKGTHGWAKTAQAIATILDERLFITAGYASQKDYVAAKWGWTRDMASDLSRAARVVPYLDDTREDYPTLAQAFIMGILHDTQAKVDPARVQAVSDAVHFGTISLSGLTKVVQQHMLPPDQRMRRNPHGESKKVGSVSGKRKTA